MSSLFCRHNRFTAECPICSKNSVLSRPAPVERAKPARPRAKASGRTAASTTTSYPHVSAGPIEHEGRVYEVRLEKVPGGMRLGEWRGGTIERRAPVLPASMLRELFDEARGRALVGFDLEERRPDDVPVTDSVSSAGRSGDMNEELRLGKTGEAGFVQVARWVFWPGEGVGWEFHDAPVLQPEARFREVLERAVEAGLI